MPPSSRGVRSFWPALLALLALLSAAACGGSGGAKPTATPTATPQAPTTPAATTAAPNEAGIAPFYWRTEDGFRSLRAGGDTGYKVVFRITNGYAEDTLRITAKRVAGGQSLGFEAGRVQVGGGDRPGSYYATNILLPQPGRWDLTVVAGEDEITIPVEVGEPGPSAS